MPVIDHGSPSFSGGLTARLRSSQARGLLWSNSIQQLSTKESFSAICVTLVSKSHILTGIVLLANVIGLGVNVNAHRTFGVITSAIVLIGFTLFTIFNQISERPRLNSPPFVVSAVGAAK